MLVTLVAIGFAGINMEVSNGTPTPHILSEIFHSGSFVFSLLLVALWPFVAFEMVCDLIEEAKNPLKHIPKAMFVASIVMPFAYSLVAFAAMKQVPAAQLANTDIPHWVLGKTIFGDAGKIL